MWIDWLELVKRDVIEIEAVGMVLKGHKVKHLGWTVSIYLLTQLPDPVPGSSYNDSSGVIARYSLIMPHP